MMMDWKNKVIKAVDEKPPSENSLNQEPGSKSDFDLIDNPSDRLDPLSLKSASVIVGIVDSDIPQLFLTKRSDQLEQHSGQIAFPGGKVEIDDRDLIDTALREAEEEVSIKRKDVEIIGQLTELYIPPSRFIVQPVVAFSAQEPQFSPDPVEVEKVIQTPLSRIVEDDVIREKEIFLPKYNTTIETSYFDIDEQVVWGATAMILSELRSVLRLLDWQSK